MTAANSNTDTKKNPASKAKFIKSKNFFFARQFYTLYELKYSNLRPLLFNSFPQGFGKSKKVWTLDFGKWGQKKHLNGVNKGF